MNRALILWFVLIGTAVVLSGRADADEPAAKSRWPVLRANFLADPPNVVAPTMGGTQLWGDEIVCGPWRIQSNVVTGHCRLLDPDDVRHAWGGLAVCQRHLDTLKQQGKIPPLRPIVVVVLHGLAGNRQQMSPLASYLEDNGNWSVISITYPSTRGLGGRPCRGAAGHRGPS